MRGRKPKPTALKVVEGNPGRRPLNKDEPQLPPGVPEAPAHMTPGARAEWGRVAPMLAESRVLTQGDRGALSAYCDAWDEYARLHKRSEKMARFVTTEKGYVMEHPIHKAMRQARADMLKAAAELGLTPVARSRVKAVADPGEKDEFESFLKGAG